VGGNFNKGAREMLKKIGLGLVVAVTGLMGMQESVQAQDPFAFQFGYALGFIRRFTMGNVILVLMAKALTHRGHYCDLRRRTTPYLPKAILSVRT
jgi:hypothetical protein